MDSTEIGQIEELEAYINQSREGRPTKFRMEMLPQVRKMAKAGMTDLEIADVLGISVPTFYQWQSQYQQFSKALTVGKAALNNRVKRSLFHRAIGYTHEAEKVFKGSNDQIVRAATREHVPPDTNAAVFWLKNREPDKWRDKIDIEGKIELGLADSLQKARARLKDANPQTIEGESISDQSASE